MLLRQSRRVLSPSLLAPRLNLLRLSARSLSSASANDDDRLSPPPQQNEEKKLDPHSFHLLPAAAKAFQASAGHFIVPYWLRIPSKDEVVVNGRVVSPGEAVKVLSRNRNGDIFGRVKDVSEVAWPPETLGMDFGPCLRALITNRTHRRKHPQVIQELRDIGFPVDVDWKKHSWREQVLAPLEVFYATEGHSLVPTHFIVPRDDPQWPEASWGVRLGVRVSSLRSRMAGLPKWQVADLASVDFSSDVKETLWSTKVLPALQLYARLNGNCEIGRDFIVPTEDPWPSQLWGMRLGEAAIRIRKNNYFDKYVARDATQLEAIGFERDIDRHEYRFKRMPLQEEAIAQVDEDGTTRDDAQLQEVPYAKGNYWDRKWRERVLPSLQTFARVFGDCDVPDRFIVPSSYPWPKATWALKLGVTVTCIRSRGTYKQQAIRDAAQLEAIGFVWGSKQRLWDDIYLPAFRQFYQQYGHCLVPHRFVVPSEAPWPQRAWGVKLGFALSNMKKRGDYEAQRVQDRDALDAIEFPEIKTK